MKHLILITSIALTACGNGAPTMTASAVEVKTYGCDSSIVAIMSTMGEPSLLGLGVPDTTTYSTTGQNHILAYDFTLARTRIEFEYNINYCRETVTRH
jgi:hypothetical protein